MGEEPKTMILCSADCKHNTGRGYYNICKHPTINLIPQYRGITRIYRKCCDLLEKPSHKKEDRE